MDSIVTEVWDTDFFNKSHILIWRVSSRIYQSNSILHLPTELFCLESVIFYARQSEATEIINPGKLFAFSTGGETAATALKRFRGKGDSRIGFHVLKEWNGSSEALRWLSPKGGRLCRPQPRRGGRASISAALEDTAVAFFGGLDPGNQRDFKPQRHPLNGAREHLLPSAAFPLGLEIRGEDEGKHWCFQRLVCPPCQAMSNIMFCQGYNVLLIAIQNLLIYINTTTCWLERRKTSRASAQQRWTIEWSVAGHALEINISSLCLPLFVSEAEQVWWLRARLFNLCSCIFFCIVASPFASEGVIYPEAFPLLVMTKCGPDSASWLWVLLWPKGP